MATVFLCGLVALPTVPVAAERPLGADPAAACAALSVAGTGAIKVATAALAEAKPLTVAPGGPTPAARISPATPQLPGARPHRAGRSERAADPVPGEPADAVERPSVQYGGGGFNGVLITGSASCRPRPTTASPLAQGFVTVGTDPATRTSRANRRRCSRSTTRRSSTSRTRRTRRCATSSVELMRRAYGRAPDKLYFVGSSEGGREGLTMAQRYPKRFDGIFSRVPVIHWTGLQHAGLRDGLATMGEGWIRPPQVKLVHDAVLPPATRATAWPTASCPIRSAVGSAST